MHIFAPRHKSNHNAVKHQSLLPPALFPTREYAASASTWAKSIQDLGESPECRLRRIVHCQAKAGPRHEFLLVYVHHPSGRDAVVFAERATSLVQDVGTASVGGRVQLSPDGTETGVTRHIAAGWAEVHTVRFPKASQAPSVAHLAALLTMLDRHALSPGASAEVQSGWFVYSVTEVLRTIFGGEVKTSKGWVRVPYGGMKVERMDAVDALIREFTPAWHSLSGRWTTERSTERTSQRQQEKRAEMDAFMGMLRTMNV